MLHTCVQKFDVTDTAQTILVTKRSLIWQILSSQLNYRSLILTTQWNVRLHLDVDIELSELNWAPKPNRTSIGNGLQYQFCCLDVDEITSWN